LSEYEYTKLSLNKELLDKIQQFIDEYPEKGYRNITHFVEDSVRHRADELQVFELTPRFKHINTYEDHATIEDKKAGIIDIYPKEDGTLYCEHCDKTNCEHVKFALTVPKIMKPLENRGWKHKD